MRSESTSYRGLLAIENIPLVLIAACMSRLGGRMFSLLIILHALSRFGSPEFAGWLSFAGMVPGLIVSPVLGALLDRVGAQRAIVMDLIVSSVLVATLVIVDVLGLASQSTLLLIGSIYSLTNPLGAAGIRTLLPRLVSAADLDRINAVDTAIYAVVDVLGPALAGALFSFLGGTATFAVVAVAYGIAVSCVIPIQLAGDHSNCTGSIWRQAMDGLDIMYWTCCTSSDAG